MEDLMERTAPIKENAVVYIADDEETNLFIMKATLKVDRYDVHAFDSGQSLLTYLDTGLTPPDLMLLDVMMPGLSGFDVCAKVRERPAFARLPIVLVTGLDDIEQKVQGLDSGADDYITKPFHPMEVRARVKNLLRLKFAGDELERTNLLLSDEKLHLEETVRERTRELENTTLGVVAALEKANALNDTDTGNHLMRVCAYSELLAERLGLPGGMVNKLRRYASLHDVGKVGLPDEVLKKPGPLTKAEFEAMKAHTLLGYELLTLARSDPMARNVALCHHERFNGAGYPYGLKESAIPLEARIVALADVFDALTTKRVYKNAYSLDMAMGMIEEERGEHFDPRLVDIHLDSVPAIKEIMARYEDTPNTLGDNALPEPPHSPLARYEN
jgi:putative two-component system response regulator